MLYFSLTNLQQFKYCIIDALQICSTACHISAHFPCVYAWGEVALGWDGEQGTAYHNLPTWIIYCDQTTSNKMCGYKYWTSWTIHLFLFKVSCFGLFLLLRIVEETFFSQSLPGNGWFCLILLLLFSCRGGPPGWKTLIHASDKNRTIFTQLSK